MRIPKVGDDVYIPGAIYMSHGMDDYVGGLARIVEVIEGIGPGNRPKYMIRTQEIPRHTWSWEFLQQKQEELKARFGENRAYPDPDDRPEFNRWD